MRPEDAAKLVRGWLQKASLVCSVSGYDDDQSCNFISANAVRVACVRDTGWCAVVSLAAVKLLLLPDILKHDKRCSIMACHTANAIRSCLAAPQDEPCTCVTPERRVNNCAIDDNRSVAACPHGSVLQHNKQAAVSACIPACTAHVQC